MKVLDLFSKAGGAARGYQRAGFHVTGIDIEPQPRYAGDVFIQADALEYLAAHGHEFDVIHASPPCQAYSEMKHLTTRHYEKLIPATRDLIRQLGKPYVIENVRLAAKELEAPVMLCGHQFGLKTYRHRMFEIRPFVFVPPHLKHPEPCPASGRGKSPTHGFISVTGNGGAPNLNMPYLDYAGMAMGIDWMTREELSEAIPPAYTEYIGRALIQALAIPER